MQGVALIDHTGMKDEEKDTGRIEAFSHPEFKKAMEHYPPSAVASPHLFTRLTVPNLCVGP
jgi:hypothetical protein